MEMAIPIATAKFTCALWLSVTLLRLGRAEDVSNNSETDSGNFSIYGSPSTPTTGSSSQTTYPAKLRSPRASLRLARRACSAPRQPVNGEWKIRQELCTDDMRDCKIPEGTELEPTYQLVYSCNPGYALRGNADVICQAWGSWTPIPVCDEIKCPALESVGRKALCTARFRESVSCDSPVPPRTRAEVSCRPGYKVDTTYLFTPGNILDCNEEGQWEPVPIRCIPVCGKAATRQTPFATFAAPAKISDFPWHATLYFEEKSSMGTRKTFICGATIIQANLLLTAAHCVYDEVFEQTIDPKKFFVLTGNENQDYDSPNHDYRVVKKAEVKNVYVSCNFYGLQGSYAADIALLELREPFVLSQILLPACLDQSGYSDQFLETRPYGKVAGFGRTETEEASEVLRTLTVPYIPNRECSDSRNAATNRAFITLDKFCAGHSNGSAVSKGDSGGGLVFEQYGLWYVMGIVSVGLGVNTTSGEATIDRYAYSLYTKVSAHIDWIRNVIYSLETYKTYPACRSDSQSSSTTLAPSPKPVTDIIVSIGEPEEGAGGALLEVLCTDNVTTTSQNNGVNRPNLSRRRSCCSVPQQPINGEWKLHRSLCEDDSAECKVPQGTRVEAGSQLVYSCLPGYEANGQTNVYCSRGGNWSPIPGCIEITECTPLNSVSIAASCSLNGEGVDCDSPTPPKTRAEVYCRPGYRRKDDTLTPENHNIIVCNAVGKWKPDLIECVPACGRVTTHQTPLIANGQLANIGDFPWHATLYQTRVSEGKTKKDFICGATIIHTNLLLTAGHCVWDERYKKPQDPTKLFVMTGNVFRDYDSPLHNPVSVARGAVKNIHVPCTYYGLRGNYASDIALIELQEPFQLSDVLLPACLAAEGYSEQILEPGANGKIAGFGRTATGEISGVLQTLTIPYVPYSQCRGSTRDEEFSFFITNDKFCAGYTNGSEICDGDSGGGLVLKRNDEWYVMGILSVGFGLDLVDGETCATHSYSVYTKVSLHMSWIRNVISSVEQNIPVPTCTSRE